MAYRCSCWNIAITAAKTFAYSDVFRMLNFINLNRAFLSLSLSLSLVCNLTTYSFEYFVSKIFFKFEDYFRLKLTNYIC